MLNQNSWQRHDMATVGQKQNFCILLATEYEIQKFNTNHMIQMRAYEVFTSTSSSETSSFFEGDK